MLNKLVVSIVVFFFMSFANAQSCSGDKYHKKIFRLSNGRNIWLQVCGDLLDTYGKDRVVTEFYIADCIADTTVLDTIHDEGDAFLLRPFNNGFSIVLLEMPYEPKDLIPMFFEEWIFKIVNAKLIASQHKVLSKPIVAYLKKFKEYQKIK